MAVRERQNDGDQQRRSYQRQVVDLDEIRLVEQARRGDSKALDKLVRRYVSFVRMKSSSYFLAGGDADDLVQEGLIGMYKAVRDYRRDKEASFRSFAELCITRQIITAIKTSTRNKHTPLNQYVSFSHAPSGHDIDADCTIGDCIPGSEVDDPAVQVVSTQELESLVEHMTTQLSSLEAESLTGYLEGLSYEQIAERAGCDPKTIDNALQRVKRKVGQHIKKRTITD